jgi:hypothetical protein
MDEVPSLTIRSSWLNRTVASKNLDTRPINSMIAYATSIMKGDYIQSEFCSYYTASGLRSLQPLFPSANESGRLGGLKIPSIKKLKNLTFHCFQKYRSLAVVAVIAAAAASGSEQRSCKVFDSRSSSSPTCLFLGSV